MQWLLVGTIRKSLPQMWHWHWETSFLIWLFIYGPALLFCYTIQIDHNFNDASFSKQLWTVAKIVWKTTIVMHCILGKMSKTVTIQGEKFVMDSKGKTLHRVNKGTVVTFPQWQRILIKVLFSILLLQVLAFWLAVFVKQIDIGPIFVLYQNN